MLVLDASDDFSDRGGAVGDEGPEWLRELAVTVGGAARVALSYRESFRSR
jgi:hypothetical protein